MVVPCLPAGERVQLLADWGERDVVGEEPRGGRSAAALGTSRPTGSDRGQAEGAARRLTDMPVSGSCTPVYECSCLHIVNVSGTCQFILMSFLSGAPAESGACQPVFGVCGNARRWTSSALAPGLLACLGGCSQGLGDEVEIAVFFEESGGAGLSCLVAQ